MKEETLQNIKRLECSINISYSKRPASLGGDRVAPAGSWVAFWLMGPELIRFSAYAPTLGQLMTEIDKLCSRQR